VGFGAGRPPRHGRGGDRRQTACFRRRAPPGLALAATARLTRRRCTSSGRRGDAELGPQRGPRRAGARRRRAAGGQRRAHARQGGRRQWRGALLALGSGYDAGRVAGGAGRLAEADERPDHGRPLLRRDRECCPPRGRVTAWPQCHVRYARLRRDRGRWARRAAAVTGRPPWRPPRPLLPGPRAAWCSSQLFSQPTTA